MRRVLLLTLVVAAACDIDIAGSPVGGEPELAFQTEPLRYTAVDLGHLGGGSSLAFAVNDLRQVVGASLTSDGATHAFLWDDGTITDLGSLAGGRSAAHALNNRALIAGASNINADLEHAVVWRGGVITDLGGQVGVIVRATGVAVTETGNVLANVVFHGETRTNALLSTAGVTRNLGGLATVTNSAATAINPARQVVGRSVAFSRGTTDFWHAFIWQNGVMTDLGVLAEYICPGEDVRECSFAEANDVNGFGHAAGMSRDANGQDRAVIWRNGSVIDLGIAPSTSTRAIAINDRGQVAAQGASAGYIWEGLRPRTLGSLGGGGTTVAAMNGHGMIVGSSQTAAGRQHAFVWYRGAMTDLSEGLLDGEDARAVAINEKGDIIGVTGRCSEVCASLEPPNRAILWQRVVR